MSLLAGGCFALVVVLWVRFAFRYSITQADKTAGQLTFTAQASILDHRDAILDNKQLSSTPVRIV